MIYDLDGNYKRSFNIDDVVEDFTRLPNGIRFMPSDTPKRLLCTGPNTGDSNNTVPITSAKLTKI